MYGYYLGASLGIPCPWKKYLTMLQLGQFVVCFTHACMCWVRGLVPGWLCALQLWVMSNMLVLFTNFYMKQYSAKKAGKADKGKGKQDKQDSKQDALTEVQQLVTAADSKKSAKSLRFTVVKGEVYEVSNFLQVHPGGEHLLSLALGRDATILFQSYHIRDSVVEAQLKQWKAPEGVTVELLRTAGLLNGVIASAEDHTEHKFPLPGDSAMYKTLKARVAKEVLTGSADKSGARGGQDWQTALILGTWIACWYMYVTSPSVFTGVLLGLAAAWCGLAVQHTANHGALFQSPDLNVLFGMADDITCGGSSVVWRYHHQLSHHLYTNHIELDQDAHSSFPLLRMDRTQPYKSFHKWQPFYAPIAFALYYFSVQMGDFETVMSKKVFRVRLTGVDKTGVKLSGISAIGEVPLFYIGKAIHFSLLLFIPFYYSGFQWTVTLPAFFAYTSTGSFVLSMLFIVSHNVLGTKEIDTVAATNDSTPAGKTVDPRKDWAAWQIDTSASWGGAIGGFFTGGLNLQIEHHLFPGVAHQHYPAIAKIVKEECANHGLPYHGYDNLALIVVDYFKFMAEMGTPPKGWAANAKKEKKQA
jgi:fatty acid desaturase (delta-4 desaturase)